jgi:outer membrane immunogenic protein
MRRLSVALIAAASLGALTQFAFAADMPTKAPAYRAPAIIPYSWTGFYVGVNAGYTWGPWDASASQVIFDPSTTHDPKVNGWLGGLQAGYNWQSGAWVYGVEGDIQITGAKDDDNWSVAGLPPAIILTDFLPGPAGGGTAFFTNEWKLPWFATFRGRLGFLPAERWLVYVTGGLAVGESKYNMTFTQSVAGGCRCYSLSDDVTRAGWTAGGGVETALARNWTAKLEYLYVDLGTHSIDTVDVDGVPFHVEHKIRNHALRLGLNYKFN